MIYQFTCELCKEPVSGTFETAQPIEGFCAHVTCATCEAKRAALAKPGIHTLTDTIRQHLLRGFTVVFHSQPDLMNFGVSVRDGKGENYKRKFVGRHHYMHANYDVMQSLLHDLLT